MILNFKIWDKKKNKMIYSEADGINVPNKASLQYILDENGNWKVFAQHYYGYTHCSPKDISNFEWFDSTNAKLLFGVKLSNVWFYEDDIVRFVVEGNEYVTGKIVINENNIWGVVDKEGKWLGSLYFNDILLYGNLGNINENGNLF